MDGKPRIAKRHEEIMGTEGQWTTTAAEINGRPVAIWAGNTESLRRFAYPAEVPAEVVYDPESNSVTFKPL